MDVSLLLIDKTRTFVDSSAEILRARQCFLSSLLNYISGRGYNIFLLSTAGNKTKANEDVTISAGSGTTHSDQAISLDL